MDYINPVLRQLKTIRQNLPDLFLNGMLRRQDEIRDLIHQRWLLGLRPDGTIIGFYQERNYAFEKVRNNPLAGFGHVDLVDEGNLWKGIRISPFGNDIEVFSIDAKYNAISDKYGDVNFNLSDEERNIVVAKVVEEIYLIISKAYA